MIEYLVRRVMQMIPLLFIISIFSFAITEFAPGDPVMMYISREKRRLTAEELDVIRHELGLDRPVHIRYLTWIKNMFEGNWGYSLRTSATVREEIMTRLPNTMILGGLSLLLTIVISIPIGVLSALKRHTALDYIVTVGAFVGISMPSFWLGLLLIEIFANRLGILPSVGMTNVGRGITGWAHIIDIGRHLILPAITLSFTSIAYWSRYQRATLIETLTLDYITTARGKGLSERIVVFRHAFRNALIPVVTLAGLSLPDIVNGAYITESVFGWPGMGRLGITAIQNRDYPVVMGVTMLSALLVVVGNLMADILYVMVDPRIRYR